MNASDPQMRPWVSLRGPFLIAAVLLPSLWPYVPSMSLDFVLECLAKALIVLFGCLVLWNDVMIIVVGRIRAFMETSTEDIVVDKVMQSVFDPFNGWIASFVAAYFGSFMTYGMPTTKEDRIRLVQSTMGVDVAEADRLLHEPGAFRSYLPRNVQRWCKTEGTFRMQMGCVKPLDERVEVIDEEDDDDDHVVDVNVPVVSIETRSRRDDPMQDEGLERLLALRELVLNDDGQSSTSSADSTRHGDIDSQTGASPNKADTPAPPVATNPLPAPGATLMTRTEPAGNGQTPLDVLRSIAGQLLHDRLQQALQKQLQPLSETALEDTAKVAGVALLLQMLLSKRARQVVYTSVQASVTLGLLAALTSSAALLVAKKQMGGGRSTATTEVIESATKSLGELWSGSLSMEDLSTSAKQKLERVAVELRKRGITERRLKGLAAALVMFYFTTRRRRTTVDVKAVR